MTVTTTTTKIIIPTVSSVKRRICCGDEAVVVDRPCMGNGKRADNAVTVLCKYATERLSIVIQILQHLFTNLTVSLKHAPKGNAVTNNDEAYFHEQHTIHSGRCSFTHQRTHTGVDRKDAFTDICCEPCPIRQAPPVRTCCACVSVAGTWKI